MIVILGLLSIQVLQLVIGVFISSGAYDLAQLKAYKHELGTTSEILAAEVDSLSSQQNLANAAEGLGMVANTNPVFLSVSAQKVYGKPTAAFGGDSSKVARNLVPNSMMLSTTDVGSIKAKQAAAVATAKAKSLAKASLVSSTNASITPDVAPKQTTTAQVAFSGGTLLASPTH
jgi:Na+-transporting NADH:ubiquinone oxidoreductase subunit NqrC